MEINSLSNRLLPLTDEMLSRGIECRQIPSSLIFEAKYNDIRHIISQYTLPIIPNVYGRLLDNKSNFKAIINHYEIPFVLDWKLFSPKDMNKAIEWVNDAIGFPVICKPQFGAGTKLVYANIKNEEELKNIWSKNYINLDYSIIIEKYLVKVKDYRFFVFKEHSSAVLCRHDPSIICDGHYSIRQLVNIENNKRKESGKLAPLIIDHNDIERVLYHQGFNLDSIPQNNTCITLKYGADITSGGFYESIPYQDVNSEYWKLIEKIWRIFPGMPYFSIDILSTDISLEPSTLNTAICESHVGANGVLLLDPPKGPSVNIVANLVDLLFPQTRGMRVPVRSAASTVQQYGIERQSKKLQKQSG